jgi:hypothetical protein
VSTVNIVLLIENCLMPLCPSCIVEHTEEHYRWTTKPLYMNLYDALFDARENCLTNIRNFESYTDTLVTMILNSEIVFRIQKKAPRSNPHHITLTQTNHPHLHRQIIHIVLRRSLPPSIKQLHQIKTIRHIVTPHLLNKNIEYRINVIWKNINIKRIAMFSRFNCILWPRSGIDHPDETLMWWFC